MSEGLLLAHFAATWYLAGLCWLVQRVQYPLLARVGRDAFAAYEQAHVARIGPVVGPMMVFEAATALSLVGLEASLLRRPDFLAALVLLGILWLSTFAVQVPLHRRLAQGFDADAHTALVRSNWIRTLAWSGRGLLLLHLLLAG